MFFAVIAYLVWYDQQLMLANVNVATFGRLCCRTNITELVHSLSDIMSWCYSTAYVSIYFYPVISTINRQPATATRKK